jgi:hypothetical protein
VRLIDEAGRVRYGCFDGPLAFNHGDFRLRGFYGGEVSALRRRLALGGFTFIGISTGEVFVGLAAVRLGYAAQVFGYAFDFTTGRVTEAAARTLPYRLAFPLDPDESAIGFRGSGCTLRVDKSHADASLTVEAAFGEGLRVAGRFRYGFEARPLRVVNPSCGDPRRFTFTEKCAPLAAESLSVKLDGVERAGEPGRSAALYDWSAGFFNRHTNWLWAAFAGFLEDGTPVGANFAALVNESFYPENAFWIGGARTRLPRVIFDCDPVDPRGGAWRIFTEDGSVDLRFQPLGERGERAWLPFVKLNFTQLVGEFSGRLGEARLDGIRGVAEVHLSVW